jgi:hypothetical protein
MAPRPSGQWTSAAVLKQLRKAAERGEAVSAQVFLNDDVSDENLPEVVERLVTKADRKAGKAGAPAKVGKIHRLAKSFSLEADPDVIAAVAEMQAVKTILPSQISDVFPRPVKSRRE